MTQKNSEDIYKALNEEERTLLEKDGVWREKAFKGKENYAALGNMGGKLVLSSLSERQPPAPLVE